jgi:hypothetical protein
MMPVKCAHATRAKYLCAKPAAPLRAQGKVAHVSASLVAIEDEFCDFGPDGLLDRRSPDRLDALVRPATARGLGGAEGEEPRYAAAVCAVVGGVNAVECAYAFRFCKRWKKLRCAGCVREASYHLAAICIQRIINDPFCRIDRMIVF